MADYDPIAWFYHHHWCARFRPAVVQFLEHALLPHVPPHAHLLDVCCGEGHIARELHTRGYRIIGLDASLELLRFARANSPGCHFVCADARRFRFAPTFDGVLSTFDSMNHMLTPEDLAAAFRNIQASLRPGGVFVFDINLEERFQNAWNDSAWFLDDDYACILRGSYDPATCLGRTDVTLFRNDGAWHRTDATMMQRAHDPGEVLDLLRAAGFATAEQVELPCPNELSEGRGLFRAA